MGGFTTINGGTPRSGLAELDIPTGIATSWAPTQNGFVKSLLVSPSFSFIGGTFNQYNGLGENKYFVPILSDTKAILRDPN